MNERKICPLCGFANGPKYHFCKNCGAALEPFGASKQPPVADVFFGEGTAPEYGPEEGAVDIAAAGKPGQPYGRRKKVWRKWGAGLMIALVVFAGGLCAGLLINSSGENNREDHVGRRIDMDWEKVSVVFSSPEIVKASAHFHNGPKQYWSPKWSALEFGTQKVGDYLFEFLYDTLNVYTEDLLMYRQLKDYEIIAAVTDGNKVYMQVEPVFDNALDDQFAVWDVEKDEFIFLDAIVMWPDIPSVGLAGGTERGIYYYRSTDRSYADWYCYDFYGGTMNMGSHMGALLYVGQYEGEEFFISKRIPFSVDFHIDRSGILEITTPDGSGDVIISETATVVRIYENDIYFLEQQGAGVVFKKYSLDKKNVEMLCDTPVHATEFELILGGNAAVFSCGMYNLDGSFPRDMCGFADFRGGKLYEMEAPPSSAVFGGRKGYLYDRENQKLYCYEPLTCKISEIYEAPEGWFVYSAAEMSDKTLCLRLTNEADPKKVEHKKIEISMEGSN